jgi:dTDP-4-amino-4,6-dideoxygalactose transaminase
MDEIGTILEERADIDHRYEAALNNYVDMQHLQTESERNYSYFPVALREESELLRVTQRLNQKDINPKRYFYPSLDTVDYLQPQQPQWISRELSKRVLCLPIFPGLTKASQNDVVKTLLKEIANPATYSVALRPLQCLFVCIADRQDKRPVCF